MCIIQNCLSFPLARPNVSDQETIDLHSAKLHQLGRTEIVQAIAASLVFCLQARILSPGKLTWVTAASPDPLSMDIESELD